MKPIGPRLRAIRDGFTAGDLVTVLIGCLVGASIWLVGQARMPDQTPVTPAAVRILEPAFRNPQSGDPLVIWDAAARRLTILDAMPRDAEICYGSDCILLASWQRLATPTEARPSK